MRKIQVLKEASLGVPYDVTVDYIVSEGKKESVVRNKSGATPSSSPLIIEEGETYEVSDLYEFGNGHVSFLIESYNPYLNPPAMTYSWITYDSKQEAKKDGWRV